MKKTLLFISLFLLASIASAQDARTIINEMLKNVAAGKTYEYTMVQNERINGKMYRNKIFTKFNVNPVKVFIDNLEGDNAGTHVLYVHGENSNKVLVSVLWGVSLSPFNSKIRANQHHTILDSGFKLLLSSIKDGIKRADAENEFNTVFKLAGEVTFDGKKCYKIIIDDPTFTYEKYTIKGGESLYDISIKRNICEQLIVERNANLKNFYSAKDGLEIEIPSSYARKTILYIDKSNYHPIYQEMHDEKGLFEKYEFLGLKVNPKFADNEFKKDFPGYKF
jgi:outer membrane lipoprotein-sorting protein